LAVGPAEFRRLLYRDSVPSPGSPRPTWQVLQVTRSFAFNPPGDMTRCSAIRHVRCRKARFSRNNQALMHKRLRSLVIRVTSANLSLPRDRWVSAVRRGCAGACVAAFAACSAMPGAPSRPRQTTPPASAGAAVDHARLERDVLAELNAARSNPAAYAANLTLLLSQFSGNLLRRPGWPTLVQTQEGP
jgi:hypothetical protein